MPTVSWPTKMSLQFRSLADRYLYLLLGAVQILVLQIVQLTKSWITAAALFFVLAFILLSSTHFLKKQIHSVYDVYSQNDRRRHQRQFIIVALILLMTGTSVLRQFYFPQRRAAELVASDRGVIEDEIVILAVETRDWGDTELLALGRHNIGLQLILKTDSPYWEYGDRIRLGLSYDFFPGAQNPGGFDEKRYRLSQGIILKAETDTEISDIITLKPKLTALPQRTANRLNTTLSLFFIDLFGETFGALAAAMLIGNECFITSEIKRDFQLSGLSHLLVVSGSNVSLVLTLLLPLTNRSGMKWQTRQFIILPVLLLFGFLIQWDASVSRAIAMNLVMLIGRMLKRPYRSSTSLGLAVVLILSVNPSSALKIGFLMSSVVSFALMTLTEPLVQRIVDKAAQGMKFRRQWTRLEKKKQDRVRLTLAAGVTPLIAQFAVMPFSMQIGSVFTWLSVPINWIAVPLSALLTVLLTLISPMVVLAPITGINILQVLTQPIRFLLLFMSLLSGMPGQLSIDATRLPKQFIYYYILIAIILLGYIFMKNKRKLAVLVLFYSGCLAVCFGIAYIISPNLSIYFLSVGQGDSVLIQTKQGMNILIDTGTNAQGSRILPDVFYELEVKSLDLLILTHMHADHYGATEFLIDNGFVKSIVSPPPPLGSSRDAIREREVQLHLQRKARDEDILWAEMLRGDRLHLSKDYSLTCIHPHEQPIKGGNDSSLVLMLEGNRLEVLFTGDVEQSGEDSMVRDGMLSDVDILKVAHHGSNSSSTMPFLEAVQAEIALVSVGSNLYGHPHDAVLQSLHDMGAVSFRTDEDGALVVHSSRKGWEAYRFTDPEVIWKGY